MLLLPVWFTPPRVRSCGDSVHASHRSARPCHLPPRWVFAGTDDQGPEIEKKARRAVRIFRTFRNQRKNRLQNYNEMRMIPPAAHTRQRRRGIVVKLDRRCMEIAEMIARSLNGLVLAIICTTAATLSAGALAAQSTAVHSWADRGHPCARSPGRETIRPAPLLAPPPCRRALPTNLILSFVFATAPPRE